MNSTQSTRTALILGASAGLGRALAEQLAQAGYHLFLLARSKKDLQALSRDLELRFNVRVAYRDYDLSNIDPKIIREVFFQAYEKCDLFIYVAGYAEPDKDSAVLEPELITKLIDINFISPIRITNTFLPLLEQQDHAQIIFISSVAAVRARKKNMVYGAAKSASEYYMNSLRHYIASSPSNIDIQIYRAGFLDTAMNYGQKRPFPKMPPEKAAKAIVKNLGKSGIFYIPRWWQLIMCIFKLLPWSIYKKLNV